MRASDPVPPLPEPLLSAHGQGGALLVPGEVLLLTGAGEAGKSTSNQADQLFFDQIVEAAMSDNELRQAAAVNPEDKFELVFGNLLEQFFVERMDQNEEIFICYMNDTSDGASSCTTLPLGTSRCAKVP